MKCIVPLLIFFFSGSYCTKIHLGSESYDTTFLVLSKKNPQRGYTEGKKIVISSDHPLASDAGLEIYRKGGNIVDSAIAASFAISVLRPHSTGLGGGGFMLLRLNHKTQAFDFRERAPKLASRDMYQKMGKGASLRGWGAVATPGMIPGLLEIHKMYGRLTLKEVLGPALRLAESGFTIYPDLYKAIVEALPEMDTEMKNIFTSRGMPKPEGSLLVQKDLALTLRSLSEEASLEVSPQEQISGYVGEVQKKNIGSPFLKNFAKKLEKVMLREHGLLRREDVEKYQILQSSPIEMRYKNFVVQTMPLPSSGIFVLGMLKELETLSPENTLKLLFEKNKPMYYEKLIQLMQGCYQMRAKYGGDPSFYKTSKEAYSILAKENYELRPPLPRSNQTTHISILDEIGNAVSTTQSINYKFGARVVLEGTGIILNDTMDDFSASPGSPNVYGLIGSEANAIAPMKTPLSSMSPIFVLEDIQVAQEAMKGEQARDEGLQMRLSIGAPGGSHIITTVFQGLVNDLEMGLHPFVNVAQSRIHFQNFPKTVFFESKSFASQKDKNEMQKKLRSKYNLNLEIKPSFAKLFIVKRKGAALIGASDPRGDGEPRGE